MRDLVIIGAGPGGYIGAIRASQLGMKVALVEKEALGGTCLNRGCIPTKAYFQNATVLRTLDQLDEYNIRAEKVSFDLAAAKTRKERIVAQLAMGIGNLLKGRGVELHKGSAVIKAPGLVQVGNKKLAARRILIASGSQVKKLSLPGAGLPGVITSDELLEMDIVPQRLVVIGGGSIGLEFACIFNAFGSKVTILECLPSILNTMDQEIIKRMNIYLKKQGIKIHTQTCIEKIEKKEAGLEIIAQGKKGSITCKADVVLQAVGRKPFSDGLGLEQLGVRYEQGFIQVDEKFETNISGIYAVGDVIEGPMLAHAASAEAIAAVENMAGFEHRVNYDAIPDCVFSFPEVAAVGLSQEEALARGIKIKIGKFPFAANGKALAMGATEGLVKVIADAQGTIIGIHIIGPHASDLISGASVIVHNKLKTMEVAGTTHPHPTLGEALLEAVLDVDARSWHTLPKG